jgi:hypothetical protein
VEAAGGGNYQTLINSALRNYVREVTSEIAEDPRYGRDSMIDRSGPMSPRARTRSARAKKKAGRSLPSFRVKRELLSQSGDLARRMGVSREELIERGLKAVLAAQGKL